MPRSAKAKKGSASQPDTVATRPPTDSFRAGLPAHDSVLDVTPLAPTTVRGPQYRIIKTNEVDAYDPGATGLEQLPPGAAPVPPTGDQFQGSARQAAKLSIGKKKIEPFADLKDLLSSLPAEAGMIAHTPPILTTPASGRVAEEQRNVRVKVFLYAASREMDNDFHLILGRQLGKAPELYMTMELSGLPPPGSPSIKNLKAARDAFNGFFKAQLPGLTYDFYDPPVPVEIEGSLFFDMTHSTGPRPGPKSLKSRMPTIWEVHPITKIVFKP